MTMSNPGSISSPRPAPLIRAACWIARRELWLLAAAAPFLLFPTRWTPLAFLFIVLTWVSRRVATGRLTLPTPLDLPIAILVAMALIGYAVSPSRTISHAKLWGILLQAALFYAMVNGLRYPSLASMPAPPPSGKSGHGRNVARSPMSTGTSNASGASPPARDGARQILRAVGLLLAVTLGVALLSLVGTDWAAVRLFHLPWLYDRIPRLVSGLPGSGLRPHATLFHPREVGATMAMLLPVPLALALFGDRRRLRWAAIAMLPLPAAVLLLSQSLQALFGFFLALFVVAVWHDRRALLALPVGLLTAVTIVLTRGPRQVALALLSLDHPIGIGVVLRVDMWSRALAMIRDMPLTGVGLNAFPIMQSQFYPGYLLGPQEVFAHNQFLQTAVDLGLPGLLGFLWLCVAFFAVVLRTLRADLERDLAAVLVGVAAGMLAFLGNGLVDCVTLGAKPLAALWAMLGIAVSISRHAARNRVAPEPGDAPGPSRKGRSGRRLLAAVLLVALAGTVVLASALALPLNRGVLRAHRALLTARSTGQVDALALQRAERDLRRALARRPHDVSALRHLASVQAWQGHEAAALTTVASLVAIDRQAPYARYAPFEIWRSRLTGQPQLAPEEALLRIYSFWMRRYPRRAEHYVQLALVWERYRDDPHRARETLNAGLEENAAPRGLLTHTLSQLD